MNDRDRATDHTRLRILEAAWRQLVDTGGRGARMGDIAAAAGVSRQALYLHFGSRAELLVATTRHVDEVQGLGARLASSRSQARGVARLDAYVGFWCDYLPDIYPLVRAIMAAADTDPDAAKAWADRMSALREGCRATVDALVDDQHLRREWTADVATDLLMGLMSVRQWEYHTQVCGWTKPQVRARLVRMARLLLVLEA
jgi:AcrR family transcriptional regulator